MGSSRSIYSRLWYHKRNYSWHRPIW